MRKGTKVGIIAVVVILVGASAFYLAVPLFTSTEIDEPLPEGAELQSSPLPASSSEQLEDFMALTEEERLEAGNQMTEEEKDQIMLDAAQLNNTIDESMEQNNESQAQQPSQTGTQPVSGSFVGTGDGVHNAEGIAKVIPLEGGGDILRLEDFMVTNGPDLYVYLSTDESASDFVDLGTLKANIGNQNYEIPEETDLAKYNTVLIWCRAFSVLFGTAELST